MSNIKEQTVLAKIEYYGYKFFFLLLLLVPIIMVVKPSIFNILNNLIKGVDESKKHIFYLVYYEACFAMLLALIVLLYHITKHKKIKNHFQKEIDNGDPNK